MASHEVREEWHDEARNHIKVRYVVRRSDHQGDGRVLWFHIDGSLKSSGQESDGVPTGDWYEFQPDGALESIQQPQGDGSWRVTQYRAGAVYRSGLRRKNAAGVHCDDGWWDSHSSDGRPSCERFVMGVFVGRCPALEPLQKALEAGEVKRAMEELASNSVEALYFGVDALIEQGFALTLPTALDLSRVAWDSLLPRALRYVSPFGQRAVEALNDEADALMALAYMEPLAVRRVTILLWQCGGTLGPKRYPLLNETMACTEYIAASAEIVGLVIAMLNELPMEVREQMVLSELTRDAWRHGLILWAYAGCAPTHRVVTAALKAVEPMKKAQFTYASANHSMVQEALNAFAREMPKYFTGFLDTVGKKCPQRTLAVVALAQSNSDEAAPTLLAIADDSLEEARNAARVGLVALGDKAVPALEAGLTSKKSKIKALAEELLAARKTRFITDAPSAAPPSVRALCALRSSLTPEERATYAPEGTAQTVLAVESLKLAPPDEAARRLAALGDIAKVCLVGRRSDFRFQEFFWQLSTRAIASPALTALVAEVLVTAPAKGNWSASYAIESALRASSDELLDALGWCFEQKSPEIAEDILVFVTENHPGRAVRALVAGAFDARKAVREAAVKGLVKAGERATAAVLPLLARKDDGALSAATVLTLAPSAAAVSALKSVVASEKNKKRRAAFEEALDACERAQGTAVAGAVRDLASLDADLAARAAKRKKKLSPLMMSMMRWVDGTAMSSGAAQWLYGALVDAETTAPNTELYAVRRELRDDDCAALQGAIESTFAWGGEHRWMVYAAPIIANDTQLRIMASQLQSWASSGMHVLAGHGIESLMRHGRGVGIGWVEHWADEGTGKLGRSARVALESLCEARGLDRESLVEASTPRSSVDAPSVVAQIRRRLEIAMLSERSYSADQIAEYLLGNPLVREAGTGLILRDADGTLGLWCDDTILRADESAFTLKAPVTIPHPCDVDDEALNTWAKVLARRAVHPPFAQIDRSFSRDPETDLKGFAGKRIAFRAMMKKLAAAGYHQSPPEDAGMVYSWYRSLGSGWRLQASHDGYSAADGRVVGASDTHVTIGAIRRDDSGDGSGCAMLCEALSDLRKVL